MLKLSLTVSKIGILDQMRRDILVSMFDLKQVGCFLKKEIKKAYSLNEVGFLESWLFHLGSNQGPAD
ncbi:MAG: hypothetical protein RR285_04295, partial [Acinetobacter sp.]